MKAYCTLYIKATLLTKDLRDLSVLAEAHGAYCPMKRSPQAVEEQFLKDGCVEFENVKDGLLFADIETKLRELNASWAWTVSDDMEMVAPLIHLFDARIGTRHVFLWADQTLALSARDLGPERIQEAKTCQAFFETFSIEVCQSAHDVLSKKADIWMPPNTLVLSGHTPLEWDALMANIKKTFCTKHDPKTHFTLGKPLIVKVDARKDLFYEDINDFSQETGLSVAFFYPFEEEDHVAADVYCPTNAIDTRVFLNDDYTPLRPFLDSAFSFYSAHATLNAPQT